VEIELGMWVDGPFRKAGDIDQVIRERVRVMDTALLHRAAEQELAEERELDPPLRDRLGEIPVPALVLAGALDMPDAHTSAELLAARIPNATRITITDAAHLPSMERPEEFERLVFDFLGEVDS
jgi:pimeloyl-ACP methyl ester carboxylesterase